MFARVTKKKHNGRSGRIVRTTWDTITVKDCNGGAEFRVYRESAQVKDQYTEMIPRTPMIDLSRILISENISLDRWINWVMIGDLNLLLARKY